MRTEDIDRLWSQAMHEAIAAGEPFTRYRFAALVAHAEREACAKVCDEQAMRSETSMKKSKTVKARDIYLAAGQTAHWMSAAIRARGDAK